MSSLRQLSHLSCALTTDEPSFTKQSRRVTARRGRRRTRRLRGKNMFMAFHAGFLRTFRPVGASQVGSPAALLDPSYIPRWLQSSLSACRDSPAREPLLRPQEARWADRGIWRSRAIGHLVPDQECGERIAARARGLPYVVQGVATRLVHRPAIRHRNGDPNVCFSSNRIDVHGVSVDAGDARASITGRTRPTRKGPAF